MADKDDKAKTEEELKMVGPGAEALDGETVETHDDEEDDQQGQQATSETEEDSEAGSGDERVGHGEEDREAIRARRRDERRRHKEQRNRDRTELRFLRDRNEALERRFSQVETRQVQVETAGIDARISSLQGQIREAENLYEQAINAKNGEAATEAMRLRDDFRDNLRVLQFSKQRAADQARQPRGPQVDPEIQRRANEWLDENSDWFDRNLRDEDSAVAKAVEDSLFRSGRFDARTDAYWEEYDKRLRKRLPHVFGEKSVKNGKERGDELDDEDEEESSEQEERGNRRGEKRRAAPRGPRLTTGGRERPLGKNEVYVNPERIEAMKEAGVWDDPVLRQRYLKRYQDYDRNNRPRR